MKGDWDLKGWGLGERLIAFLRRYRWPLLILLLGVLLMLWNPSEEEAPPRSQQELQHQQEDEAQVYRKQMEQELTSILSKIQGAGRVSVMLTLKTGPVTNYQTDSQRSQRDSGGEHSESWEASTVILSRGSAYNEPAVIHRAYPIFQGALIVSEGAEDPTVRYALSGAVASLLGLGTDRITVVKMK